MRRLSLIGFLILAATIAARAQTYSQLWGKDGEAWSPENRLPDFSYAGYHNGERAIPDIAVAANVKDFGAKGGDETDDTAAFQEAIEKTPSGAILVPNGRYILKGILEIRKPNLVLHGESRDGVVLYCPIPLNEIKPNWGATTSGRRTSNYSWSGGFIHLQGSYRSNELARIVQPAQRAERWIAVSSTDGMKTGQWIEINQRDNSDNSLAEHLYTGDAGNTSKINGRTHATLVSRIARIDGSRIRLERPLRFGIEARWNPRVYSFDPSVTESGVENLTFEFPVTPYMGHFTELGNNPLALSDVVNCWVRNIKMLNGDSGIFISGKFCTVRGILYESKRPTDNRGDTGHHGIYMYDDDNLFTEFEYRTSFIHGLTVSHCAGNVISNGKGTRLSLDHHKRVPYANLYTNIDVGDVKDVWRCGGGEDLGKNCAGYGTFWNIRGNGWMAYPPDNFGPPSMNLVAVKTKQPSITEPDGKWFEAISPDTIEPKNIQEAQLERRLKNK